MSSLPTSTAKLEDHPVDAPLAASGGVPFAPKLQRDPITAWIELMEVVEMLCPRWPERPLVVGKDYRL
jgi:hypothetical protein